MLVIMRHGQSTWTEPSVNKFAGWVDVPLSAKGLQQAHRAGELLQQHHIAPDIVFTSLLKRSITTANIALDTCDREWIPVKRTWRLNERHYGAFQGQTRPDMLAKYGEEALQRIRRGTAVRPPEQLDSSPYAQTHDPRYAAAFSDHLDTRSPARIAGESLDDVWKRLEPYWTSQIIPQLQADRTVLIVTHGSVVRQIVRILNNLDEQAMRHLNIPTGVPMSFEITVHDDGSLESDGGLYLDEQAAKAGIAAVHALTAIH